MDLVFDPNQTKEGVLFAIDAQGNPLPDPLAPHKPGSWTWLHLSQKSDEARKWLISDSGVPRSEASAMLEDKIRPRCDVSDTGVLFIGRGVNLDPQSVPEDMVSLRAWLEHDRLITVVVRRLRSAEAVAESFAEDPRPESPGEVLALLFSQMVNRIAPVVQELADQLDELQETVIDDDSPMPDVSELSPVRLRAVTLHRYMLPMYDAANALISAPQLGDLHKIIGELRSTRDRLERIIEDLASIESRAAVTRDEMVSRRADALNQRVYTLTVLAGVCLPLSVLTGMLGMNVGGLPLSGNHGFLITILGMLTLSALSLVLLRWIKWI